MSLQRSQESQAPANCMLVIQYVRRRRLSTTVGRGDTIQQRYHWQVFAYPREIREASEVLRWLSSPQFQRCRMLVRRIQLDETEACGVERWSTHETLLPERVAA